MSADGAYAIVVIALLGSPFSPAYARARDRESGPSPLRYSAMNVAVYGPTGKLFSLTERAVRKEDIDADALQIGPNRMSWERGGLVCHIDERSSPWGETIHGTVRLIPEGGAGREQAIDGAGEHLWWPVAPLATVEVELDDPQVRFRGHGYHDANAGDVPLDETFDRWSWARARLDGTTAAVQYDTVLRGGAERKVAFALHSSGEELPMALPAAQPLPTTGWRIPRSMRASEAQVVRELEDTPFYSRSLVSSKLSGRDVVSVHEELSLSRLRSRWVQFLLGFRMGRG